MPKYIVTMMRTIKARYQVEAPDMVAVERDMKECDNVMMLSGSPSYSEWEITKIERVYDNNEIGGSDGPVQP